MTSGIYIMTNKSNGHRYVGYSEDLEIRFSETIRQLKAGTFGKDFQRLITDFNASEEEDFIFGILEVTQNDPSIMSSRSEYWKKLIRPEYNNLSD